MTIAKRSGNKQYAHMPLTMGYYTGEDLPFNYALADAFTICDQHFCKPWPLIPICGQGLQRLVI
jgi:phospholipase C